MRLRRKRSEKSPRCSVEGTGGRLRPTNRARHERSSTWLTSLRTSWPPQERISTACGSSGRSPRIVEIEFAVAIDQHPDDVGIVTGTLEFDEHVHRVVEDLVAHDRGASPPHAAELIAPRRIADPRRSKA